MGRERSSNPILNSLTRIYRFRSLAHCVTNISYWLHLNEGFRCNCIKTNKYVIFVVCTSDQVKWSISQALVARTHHPPFSNFLFTNLFSIKFLYFFIISSLFPYFNLCVSIFIQYYVNIKLHVSTLYRY